MTIPRLPMNAALLLDFDGTLVEIAPRPNDVVVSTDLRDLLRRLYQRLDGALALVSGRHVSSLRHFLPDFPGAIAGSHGAELSLDAHRIEAMHDLAIDPDALSATARGMIADHPALLVEDKPHGVVMHYRADPSLRPVVEAAMERLVSAHPGMVLQPAKMAVEMHPAGFSKDGAVRRLMALPAFAGRLPVYAGDDAMDELAIAEVQQLGGFGIKIGEGESQALYRLPDPAAVADWLESALRD